MAKPRTRLTRLYESPVERKTRKRQEKRASIKAKEAGKVRGSGKKKGASHPGQEWLRGHAEDLRQIKASNPGISNADAKRMLRRKLGI